MPVRKPNLRGVAERNALVEANQGLVRSVALQFMPSPVDLDDLISAGQFGLMRAAELWEAEKGAFTTIAYRHIYQAIKATVWRCSGVVTIPRPTHEALAGQREPLGSHVMEAGRRALAANRISIDESLQAIELSVLDDGPERSDDREAVELLLGQIPDLEARVLRLRHGLDGEGERTRVEVGRLMGVSREWIRQIEVNALERLRELASA